MINLNNINKILFLLILSSCTITSIDTVDDKKIEEEVATQEYFKKSEVIISPLDDYNIELSVMEKFVKMKELTAIISIILICHTKRCKTVRSQ